MPLSTLPKRTQETNLLHPLPQVLLIRRILNNRNNQRIQIAQRRPGALNPHPFNHLLMANPKLVPRPKERDHDGVLGVGVDARARGTELVRVVEEGGAR